jgi:hypothetical protein
MDFATPRSIVRALVLAVVIASPLPTHPALAQSWSEAGDAGPLPATAQTTAGSGALTTITGQLATDSDVDMYCINVSDPSGFFAGLLCAGHADPDLYLFNSSGQGIALATTCAGGYKSIPGAFVALPGTYYVAVVGSGGSALTGGNAMWLPGLFATRPPGGPGAGGPVTGWGGAPIRQGTGTYQLNLWGVSYCSSPVPARAPSWGAIKVLYR